MSIYGRGSGRIRLYALSTCIWCRKTKELLERLRVDYDLYHVDLLEGDARQQVVDELRRYNPRGSYPTLVKDDEVVVGFDEARIREVLGI
ncbi:MAG: glutaredoxin family protein [Myxococcota bacterium]|jgi:glutaredoxin